MIQIDDAGSGSLIGGTCIGAIRVETNEFFFEYIPLSFYNENAFKDKLYLDYVIVIVKRLLKKLEVSNNEIIQICRGYIFDRARKWLLEENFNFNSVQITDPLQTLIEKTYEEYSISLGIPEDFIRYTKYPFHFHRILKWVYADYDNRKKLCKKGWKSWSKYGNLQPISYLDKISKSNYICLKCGDTIEDNSAVKVIEYTSNNHNRIYLHQYC